MMNTRVLLVEDNLELLPVYMEGLAQFGFDDVVPFSDTKSIVSRIAAEYTRPSILLTDVFLHPLTATRYLPELAVAGIKMPVVLMSSITDPTQLNSLVLQCQYCGFFAKGKNTQIFLSQLALHLADMADRAQTAWEAYSERLQAKGMVRGLKDTQKMSKEKKIEVLRRIVAFDDAADIARNLTVGTTTVYELRKEFMGWVTLAHTSRRLQALIDALHDQ